MEWRFREATRTSGRVDLVAHVPIATMDTLATRGAHERVIVQSCDNWNAMLPGERRQLERQIQKIVHVQDVRLEHRKELTQPRRHQAGSIRLFKRFASPVVD